MNQDKLKPIKAYNEKKKKTIEAQLVLIPKCLFHINVFMYVTIFKNLFFKCFAFF